MAEYHHRAARLCSGRTGGVVEGGQDGSGCGSDGLGCGRLRRRQPNRKGRRAVALELVYVLCVEDEYHHRIARRCARAAHRCARAAPTTLRLKPAVMLEPLTAVPEPARPSPRLVYHDSAHLRRGGGLRNVTVVALGALGG